MVWQKCSDIRNSYLVNSTWNKITIELWKKMKCSNIKFAIFKLHTKTISSGKITEENLTKYLESIKNEPLIIKTISNESIAKIQDIFKNLSETLNEQEPYSFIKKLKKIGLIRYHVYKRLYVSGHDFCHIHNKLYINTVINNETSINKKTIHFFFFKQI